MCCMAAVYVRNHDDTAPFLSHLTPSKPDLQSLPRQASLIHWPMICEPVLTERIQNFQGATLKSIRLQEIDYRTNLVPGDRTNYCAYLASEYLGRSLHRRLVWIRLLYSLSAESATLSMIRVFSPSLQHHKLSISPAGPVACKLNIFMALELPAIDSTCSNDENVDVGSRWNGRHD